MAKSNLTVCKKNEAYKNLTLDETKENANMALGSLILLSAEYHVLC